MTARALYFRVLAASALAAADPASVADEGRWDGARVSGDVTSQVKQRPQGPGNERDTIKALPV